MIVFIVWNIYMFYGIHNTVKRNTAVSFHDTFLLYSQITKKKFRILTDLILMGD